MEAAVLEGAAFIGREKRHRAPARDGIPGTAGDEEERWRQQRLHYRPRRRAGPGSDPGPVAKFAKGEPRTSRTGCASRRRAAFPLGALIRGACWSVVPLRAGPYQCRNPPDDGPTSDQVEHNDR